MATIDAKLQALRRRQAAEYRCYICPPGNPSRSEGTFRTEESWWKHITAAHADVLVNFDTEDALRNFRTTKGELCKIKKPNAQAQTEAPDLNNEQASRDQSRRRAEQSDNNKQEDWMDYKVEFPASRGNGELTRGVERLKLLPRQDSQNRDSDVPMPDQPSSPIHDSIRVAAPQSNPQTIPRPAPAENNKRTRSAKAPRGRRGKKEPFDTDFDRNLPTAEDSSKTTRRLFDPNQDTIASFKATKDANKRLENPPGPSSQNNPARNTSGTGRGRKENKKGWNRNEQLPPPLESGGTQQQQQVEQNQPQPHMLHQTLQLYRIEEPAPGSREGGHAYILKNYAQLQSQGIHDSQKLHDQPPPEDDESLKLVRQPETRPISPEQLISEVKGIYAGLVMVEAKCVEVDQRQAALAKQLEAEGLKQPKLNNEQWQALIALHRTLLHEHHDFFLASQHPSASPALRRLASKYTMPARMWRHGIHSFLELLRHRLPHSMEHMLTFIYLAYSIMALLFETVPAFENTWIECLGDLGRYRMAIEDDDARDREVWTNAARTWYSKAADKMPSVGRLYHHLAILARPHVLQQLFFYCKSLSVSIPFSPARESILALFEPVFAPSNTNKAQPVDMALITLHGICFTHIDFNKFDDALDSFLSLLDNHITRVTNRWKVQGCHIAVCNIAALYEYGARGSKLRRTLRECRQQGVKEEDMEDAPPISAPEPGADFDALLPPLPTEASSEHVTSLLPSTSLGKEAQINYKAAVAAAIKSESSEEASEVYLGYAKRLSFSTLNLVLERIGDPHILPHIHTWLAFIHHLKSFEAAMRLLEDEFPWEGLTALLNSIVVELENEQYENEAFPTPEKGVGRPLPEDWTLRGLEWTREYFPDGWIENAQVDDEERLLELPSMSAIRIERILWLSVRISEASDWLLYDPKRRIFSVNRALIQRNEARKVAAASRGDTKPIIKRESSDVEMKTPIKQEEEEAEEFVDLPQSDELQQLFVQRRQLQSQLKTEKPVEQSEMSLEAIRRVSAKEGLKANYTVLVVDTNLLLSSLDIFKLLVDTNEWSVIIPNTVITELLGLNNSQGPAGELSKAAIAAIQEAVSAKQDVRVITAKGNNVTNIGFFKERLDKYNEDEMNIDDVIISITEQQGKVRAETMRANGTNPGQAQPAILITEDRNMRVKANARGVPAIAGSALRAIVAPRGDKDMSRSRSKRKSFATPLATPKQRFSDVPRSEAAGDVEAATYHITQSGGGRQPQPQSPNFKKRHKRDKDMARGGGLG